jgi:hypothetical protein
MYYDISVNRNGFNLESDGDCRESFVRLYNKMWFKVKNKNDNLKTEIKILLDNYYISTEDIFVLNRIIKKIFPFNIKIQTKSKSDEWNYEFVKVSITYTGKLPRAEILSWIVCLMHEVGSGNYSNQLTTTDGLVESIFDSVTELRSEDALAYYLFYKNISKLIYIPGNTYSSGPASLYRGVFL